MNINDFEELWVSREACLFAKFFLKHKQYGTDEDVFQNNVLCAELADLSLEYTLIVQVCKHIALLSSRAKELDNFPLTEKEMELWRESMDDISIWMFILNGLLEERFQRGVAVCKTCNGFGRINTSSAHTNTKPCPDCQKGEIEGGA